MDEFRNEDSFTMRPVYAVILTITLISFVSTLQHHPGPIVHRGYRSFD